MNNHHTIAQKNSTINKSSIYVAILTLCSRILGFVRIGVISSLFGTSSVADILNLVLSIPNNLRKLFAEGALQNSYMPSYSQTIKESKTASIESNVLLIEILFYCGLLSFILVYIMSKFSVQLTSFFFDIELEGDRLLAADLFSKAIYFLFFISISSMLSALLQTHKSFIIPALAPIVLSLSTIIMSLFLYKLYNVLAVIYGYLVGSIFQVVLLLMPILFRYKYNLKILNFFKVIKGLKFSSQFKSFIARVPLISLSVIFPMIGQQVSFYLSSTLKEGSTSAFSYAIIYWQLPIGVVINSIIAVNFAYLLTHLSTDNHVLIHNSISKGIENLFYFLVPISIIMYYFAYPGIAITLQRGNMLHTGIMTTSEVLKGFGLGLFPMGLFMLIQKIFLAYQKNMSVLLYSLLFTIADIIISILLIRTKLEVRGLSYAYSITLIIFVPIMYVHLRKIVSVHTNLLYYIKVLAANLPLFLGSLMISSYTYHYWKEGSTFINYLRFFIIFLILLTILILGYRIFGMNIISSLKNSLQGKNNL